MLEYLKKLDQELFIFLHGLQHPFWDKIMITVSDKYFWIPFYAALLAFLIYLFRQKSYVLLPAIALTIGAADSISSAIFKPWVARLRPCHDASLAVLLTLVLERRYNWLKAALFIWAAVVSYSRIYLGAHFPGDILAGALLGSLSALVFGWLFRKLAPRWMPLSGSR